MILILYSVLLSEIFKRLSLSGFSFGEGLLISVIWTSIVFKGMLNSPACTVSPTGIILPVDYHIRLYDAQLIFPFIALQMIYLPRIYTLQWHRIKGIEEEKHCLKLEFILHDEVKDGDTRFLRLAWPLEDPYEFKQAVLEFAPKGNPLREYVERAL